MKLSDLYAKHKERKEERKAKKQLKKERQYLKDLANRRLKAGAGAYMEGLEATTEMTDWFDKRTNRHIDLVGKYCRKIADLGDERFEGILDRAETHDACKFESPEYEPYVWVTWQYKCKDDGREFEGPDNIDDLMNQATEHHVKNNRHHPEFHCKKDVELINRADRDEPIDELIDGTEMEDLDLAEMVADWCAMSEERDNTPKKWADKNVNVRWGFTPEQKKTIYELIDRIWE